MDETYILFTSIDSRILLFLLRSNNEIPRINLGKKMTLFCLLNNSDLSSDPFLFFLNASKYQLISRVYL